MSDHFIRCNRVGNNGFDSSLPQLFSAQSIDFPFDYARQRVKNVMAISQLMKLERKFVADRDQRLGRANFIITISNHIYASDCEIAQMHRLEPSLFSSES